MSFMPYLCISGFKLVPIDTEHNSIFCADIYFGLGAWCNPGYLLIVLLNKEFNLRQQ